MHRFLLIVCTVCLLTLSAFAAEPADQVFLKNGSLIKGQIGKMTDGTLVITTSFAGDISVKWSEIEKVTAKSALDFVLKDGSRIKGTAESEQAGAVNVHSPQIQQPATVQLENVTAINPPTVKPITYKGNLNAGLNISDGNTKNRSGSLQAGFVARSKRQRLTLGASTNYAENNEELTQRNSKGSIKYDFFATERLYAFSNAFLEGDEFQDLKLRTALSAGPGYQLIDKGDFDNPYFNALELYTEAGVSYFNEDFDTAEDDSYVSGRWSAKLDWPLPKNTLTLFHVHEGYPGFEDIKDLYITTEQGIRFALLENMNATIQVNWRYDSTPAAGFKRTDTLYLFTIGYNFKL